MIGVVGGVGPYAGLDLVRNIFDHTLASSDQEHLDVLMFSMPSSITDRTEFLLGHSGDNPGVQIAGVVSRLEAAGATVAGIPCNTAHAEAIFSSILESLERAGSEILLLNLVDEVIESIRSRHPNSGNIGVLSTTGTHQLGIYTKALEAVGLRAVSVEPDMQESLIHPAIYAPAYGIKAHSNPTKSRARQDLITGIKWLKSRGAELVIKGCTEIALAIPEQEIEGIPLLDPAISLARALIAAIDPSKLKPLPE